MAPRGPRPALLLTLGLLAAGLAPLASGQPWVELNKIFRQNHVDHPKPPFIGTSSYCNATMRARGLYWTPVNTFVHAPIRTINSICSGNGEPVLCGLHQSKALLRVTTCTYRPQIFSYTLTSVSRNIVIGCWRGLAVFFKEYM